MANIFISHSSKDNDQTKEIFSSINEVSKSIFLDFDFGHGLKGGDKWEKELYVRVKKARIMIVALSPNWLNSQWCYKEYCMARVLRKKIIPVVITPDGRIRSWDGNDIQHFDVTSDGDAMRKLQERVRDLTHSDITKIYDINKLDAPFVGLRSFNKEEAGIFYGRNEEILDAIDKLNGMADTEHEKFLNIIGASGVGKSSFLKAGILPLLELLHTESWYLLPTFRAKQEILLNFAKTFSFAHASTIEVLAKLKTQSFKSFFDELELTIHDQLKKENIETKELKILLPIDQAEELLSSNNQEEKEHFFEILRYLLEEKSNFFVVWTLRSDHLKRYQDEAILEFLHQKDETLLLQPIASSELKTIIQEPAYSANIHIEEAVVEQIKEDIRSTTSLPLLAYLLQILYTKAKTKQLKQITLNDYQALSANGKNPVENIINEEANKILKRVKDENLMQELFLNHLISVNSNESINKQSAKLSDIPTSQQAIVEQFVEKRLFVKDNDQNDEVRVEIAHEALISSWEKLVGWIEEEKEFLLFRNHLELLYREWFKSEKNDKALLSGLSLEKAVNLKEKLYSQNIIEFIEKSIDYSDEREKRYKELYEKAIEETKKANHNIGLTFLEKAKLALKNDDRDKANLFSYRALELLNDILDITNAKTEARDIVYNFPPIRVALKIYIKESNYIYDTVCSSDGTRIISILNNDLGEDNYIKIWDAQSGQFISNLFGNKEKIRSIACPPNSKNIISLSEDNMINVWDINTNKCILVYKGEIDYILACSPNGKNIVSTIDKTIKIWDIQNGKCISNLLGHKDYIDSIAYSPNGKTIASASWDETIKIWDIKSSKCISTLKGHRDWINSVAYSPNGKNIVSASRDETIKIWDIKSSECLSTFWEHEDDIVNVSYAPNGKSIISYSEDNIIKIWNPKDSKCYFTLNQDVTNIIFSHDSKSITLASREDINVWDMTIDKYFYLFKGHEKWIESVVYAPNGKMIISSSEDKTIKIWDIQSEKCISTLKGHKGNISSIACSPDGKTIISSSGDTTVKIWDIQSGKCLSTLYGHKDWVESVAFSPNGKNIISSSGSRRDIEIGIKIWNVKSSRMLFTLKGHSDTILSIAYSPNGKNIISSSMDETIKIWDLKSKKCLATLKEHNGYVSSVAYSPTGRTLVSGSDDSVIKIWGVKSRKCLFTLHGHKSRVTSVAYSPNGKFIISGSMDKTVKVWDVKNKQCLFTLNVYDTVKSVAYSPNGKTIIAGSNDSTIKMWGIKELNDNYIRQEIEILENHFQAKLDGITLVPTKIPYTKPLWSKYHPNHWLLKLKEAKNEDEKAKAMYELGLIYDRDNENKKALEWYKKSAQKGYKEAEERVVFLEGWMRENE